MTGTRQERVDVVVVGGGTAGLNAALQLARVGRTVVLLERRQKGHSGARWVNGVLDWQYQRAGIEAATAPERISSGGNAWMVSPTGRHRFRVTGAPVVEADMRHLVDRLRADAITAGVDIRWGASRPVLELRWGRPVALRAEHAPDGGEPTTIHLAADLFVDASGRAAVLRRQVPELAERCPDVGPHDTCAAQQLVLHVADPEGARTWVEGEGVEPGDAVVALGMEGGYSTINIRVDPSFEEVSILTGSIPSLGHASGAAMVKAARERHPWMGATEFGGSGMIPLRRAYDRFTSPGLALVGDAACQVMAAHGSGIGFGLIAGKVLAEAVGSDGDPGAEDALWRYQATYLREFGATLAGYDAVRRMSVALGSDGVEELFASGVFSETLVRNGLDQRLGMLPPGQAAAAARALAKRPAIARIVVPALAAMGAGRGVYRTYPATPDPKAFRRWQSVAARTLRQP